VLNEDDKLELYLGEFQPRPIRALALPMQPRNPWLRRLAAAAVIALGVGISARLAHHPSSQVTEVTVVHQSEMVATLSHKKLSSPALTRLALDNSKEFDSYLLEESRNVLPDLRGENSTLRILVKE
jgi:hypothetical protein